LPGFIFTPFFASHTSVKSKSRKNGNPSKDMNPIISSWCWCRRHKNCICSMPQVRGLRLRLIFWCPHLGVCAYGWVLTPCWMTVLWFCISLSCSSWVLFLFIYLLG
jgi:hypothetical protein